MAVVQGPFFVTVLLLVSPGLHCSSPPPACPELCTCQRAPLLNCSSSGLSSVPQHIQDSVTELDLSQNRLDTVTLHRPYRNLRNVWLENNTITRLSLCIDKNLGAKSVRVRKTRQLGPWSRRRCVSWAPTLQLLSVERNHLIQLPEGLEGSASLWVLQLSFNRISTIRPGELRHLQQLKELHLKHNLITHLHPQMFQDLTQLRVLDLSFNMLTSLHPSMYLSLRNIGSDVRLDGNRWQCDCSMRSLRRRMSYDSDRGLQTWSVECAFPSVLSGKDLLQLEEDDLNCFGTENSPELHQDVTVYSGSEILLSCSKQDSSWLTPSDQESVSQPQASLFISDVSEKDTGLYVCMTEDHEVVSVFNLQISRVEHARRKARSVPRASPQVIPQERNQRATQSDLALAVCLSVFITFLIAFVLGVLVRPFIDVLWTKITNKRSPSATNSVSSAEQRQYENEAYSEGEEPEEIVTHRERRVTFNTVNIREDINVEYYDTLASGNQESVEAAKTEEDEHTAGESGSDNGSTEISPENNQSDARDISGTTDKRRRHKVQFEHIPDSKELEERSLSSCSDSSLSDRELKKDRMNKRDLTTPKSLQQAEDSVQQGADSSTSEIVPQLSIERTNEIPGFSSEPFADWSPHLNDTKPKDSDLWQGNEEQFDFSDSVGSNSARSSGMFGSFNDSKLNVLPTSDNQSRDDASSCSSHLSEDEPTQYTVNPDQEEEEDTKNNHNKSELTNTHLKQDARFEQQISGVDTSRTPLGFNQGNYPHDTLRPAERSEQTFSSQSSDSEQMQYRGNEKAKKEEVMEYYKPSSRIVAGERDTRKKMKPMQRSKWRGVNLGVTSFDKSLDPKAPSPPTAHSSSSSSESEAEITDRKVKHNKGRKIKKNQSAASNDISNATNPHPARWPALDHKNIPTINKRLDVKALSPTPDSSSSSDSGDNTTHVAERPGRVVNAELPFQTSGTASHDPDARWPAIDLQNIPTINRRLDIKAPSPHPDSSSSSDSDDETTHLAERPGRLVNAELPFQTSGLTSHDPDVRWPAIDLENIPSIQRHLDVKAPSPHPDSSSSSDSDDETTHLAERPGRVVNAELPFQTSGLTSHDQENIPTIQRRLDIKVPSLDSNSSSSSDDEEEVTHHKERPGKVDIVPIKNYEEGKVNLSTFPLQESETVSHDPLGFAVELNNITRIKRRLDIKAPSSPSKLLSDGSTNHTVDVKIKEANKISPHFSSSSSVEQDEYTEDIRNPSMTIKPHIDPRLLELGLSSAPCVKKRLDIKTHSPSTELSSSSDKSDSESTNIPVKVERGKTDVGLTNNQPGTQFPERNKRLFPVNRRLNIRGPPQPADSSFSSSDNGRLSSHTVRHETDKDGVGITTQEQKTMMHNINLGIPNVRRRLDIKAPSPQPDLVLDSTSADLRKSESNSSTSESEDENRDHKFKWSPKIPLIDISPIPKTDHNIKLEKYTVITDDLRNKPSDDNISPTPEINPELQSRWATMNLGISRFRKHLEITSHTNVPPNLPTSPLPDSPSSYTGESGTGNKSSRTRLKKNLEVKVTEEKSNPDSQLSGFDIPHVSRYLDIKVHEKAPATSPLHQQSDSLFSSESEGISTEYAVNRWKGTSQLSVVPDVAAPQNRTSLLVTHAFDESHSGTQVERKAGVELKSHTSEEGDASDSMWPQISLTNIPHVKRALDIRTLLPRESSSSSNSEDETDHSVPDLKPGVPRINRLLNIKAPSPKLKYSAKQSLHSSSATTDYDYSQIAYKRSIIKAPAQLNSFSSRSQTSDHPVAQAGLSHSVGDRSASLSPRGVSGIEQHGTLDVELTPEIRWKGIGRDLSDFSSASRRLDLGLLPPQRAPPAEPEHNPPDSSNFSHEIKQDGGKAYETLMHRYSYPTASRVSVASSRSVDQFDNTSRSNNEIFRALSEDRKEKKGLGALKAMSSKRLRWDMEDKDKDAV